MKQTPDKYPNMGESHSQTDSSRSNVWFNLDEVQEQMKQITVNRNQK